MATPKFVESAAELLSPEELGKMSGLEFLSGIAAGELPAPPIARTLSFYLKEVSEGRVVFEGTPGIDHYNPLGGVHGGWFGTLLDSCLACAVQSTLPKGSGYTTLEYRVNITRPLLESSEKVLAIGETLHVGRRTGTSEGRIIGAESGKLYAFGTTTCLILKL